MRQRIGTALMILAAALCLLFGLPRPGPAAENFRSTGREGAVERPPLPDGFVSVNTGELEELMTLPGLGETLALNMIEERERNGPFHYPEDLLSVKGIGTGKLEKIISLINFE